MLSATTLLIKADYGVQQSERLKIEVSWWRSMTAGGQCQGCRSCRTAQGKARLGRV